MRGVVFALISAILLCGVVLYLVEAPPLDFIETHFGFSPDGGDGSLELLLLVSLAMFVGAIGLSLCSPVK